MCDPTLFRTTVWRTATMRTEESGSSGTRIEAQLDYKDSDSPEGADGLGERSQLLKKACRPPTNRGVDVPPAVMAASPSAVRAAGSLTPSSANLSSACTVSRPRHRRVARQRTFKQRAAQPRTVGKAKPLAAQTRTSPAKCASLRDNEQSGCTVTYYCARTSATEAPDPADAVHRPAKRPRRSHLEAPPEVLWDRWRQMEPRRKRRT